VSRGTVETSNYSAGFAGGKFESGGRTPVAGFEGEDGGEVLPGRFEGLRRPISAISGRFFSWEQKSRNSAGEFPKRARRAEGIS